MLKVGSKRRRTKQEIKEEEQSKMDQENEIRTKLARLDQLEQQLAQAEQQADLNRNAAVLVSDLINNGVVKQVTDHSFTVPHAPNGPKHFDYNDHLDDNLTD